MFFKGVSSSPLNIRTPLECPESTFEEYVRKVKKESASKNAKDVVLSSEMLWNSKAFSKQSFEHIKNAFPGWSFLVLAYLRPVEEHLVSGYAQRVTGPQFYSGSFEQHVQDMESDGVYTYFERLSEISEVFGPDSIMVSWLPGLKGDVLLPVKKAIPELEAAGSVESKNQRKSWFFVTIARHLNRLKGFGLKFFVVLVERVLEKFDFVFRNSSFMENKFNPLTKEKAKYFEELTQKEMAAVRKRYRVVGGDWE